MKMYQIAENYLNILELLEDEEFAKNEDVLTALNSIEDDLKTKAENIVFMMKHFESDSKAIDAEIKRLQAMKQSKVANNERLKDYLKRNFESLTDEEHGFKLETPLFKFSLSKPSYSKLELEKDFVIPEKYQRTKITVEPDKTAIKEALKAGEHVEGAMLVADRRLTIK
ncbi:siphovirus Gp157 family protein [Phocoenobacter skyensis]|uniref:Siphovirus Gp157 family protein n=1 Tax=Phocoenobacter skyensis TaxID=97481 RepID=A0ABT9JKG6_9PAST|nr:siphovirus Gp157 family protein [Pasteurella skyensis]MDP8078369.1 siphovirus Gp157 family protein [Pasteurella skyensis]MDP8084539.1 siphovirus Gp157 family protein [Pasteurella skyensis]